MGASSQPSKTDNDEDGKGSETEVELRSCDTVANTDVNCAAAGAGKAAAIARKATDSGDDGGERESLLSNNNSQEYPLKQEVLAANGNRDSDSDAEANDTGGNNDDVSDGDDRGRTNRRALCDHAEGHARVARGAQQRLRRAHDVLEVDDKRARDAVELRGGWGGGVA